MKEVISKSDGFKSAGTNTFSPGNNLIALPLKRFALSISKNSTFFKWSKKAKKVKNALKIQKGPKRFHKLPKRLQKVSGIQKCPKRFQNSSERSKRFQEYFQFSKGLNKNLSTNGSMKLQKMVQNADHKIMENTKMCLSNKENPPFYFFPYKTPLSRAADCR